MKPGSRLSVEHRHSLQQLGHSLAELRAGSQPVAALARTFRSQSDLLAALPPAFGEVLENTLQRLESSGLFAEESCSFSQQGLLDGLELWIRKASDRLSGC